jgi:hypothetical protein
MSRLGVIKIRSETAGFLKLEAVKLDSEGNEISRRALTDWFPNIITDQGLDRMGDNADWLKWCQVGAGNATPTALDTGLVSRIAGTITVTTISSGAQATAPYFGWCQKTFRFGAGVAAGNIAEVGVGWASSGTTLYSRALVLDGGGSPTTVTVLSDEALDVTYQHRVYPPLTDTVGVININGIDYTYTVRAAGVTKGMSLSNGTITDRYGWGIGTSFIGTLEGNNATLHHAYATSGSINASITGIPSGTYNEASTDTDAAYSVGTLSRAATITFSLTNANFAGGIEAFRIGYYWSTFQVGFSPKLPKLSSNNLSLGFSHSWARH